MSKSNTEIAERVLPSRCEEFYPQSYLDGFDLARYLFKKSLDQGDLIPKERLMTEKEIEKIIPLSLTYPCRRHQDGEECIYCEGKRFRNAEGEKLFKALVGRVAVKEGEFLTVEEISKKISGFKVSREIIDNSPQVNWGIEYQQDIDWCVNVVNNQIDRIISSLKGMVQKARNP